MSCAATFGPLSVERPPVGERRLVRRSTGAPSAWRFCAVVPSKSPSAVVAVDDRVRAGEDGVGRDLAAEEHEAGHAARRRRAGRRSPRRSSRPRSRPSRPPGYANAPVASGVAAGGAAIDAASRPRFAPGSEHADRDRPRRRRDLLPDGSAAEPAKPAPTPSAATATRPSARTTLADKPGQYAPGREDGPAGAAGPCARLRRGRAAPARGRAGARRDLPRRRRHARADRRRPGRLRVSPSATRAELERLAARYALVACVSGRSGERAREIVGVDGLTYVGEHGLELDPEAEAWAPRIHAFAADAGWPAEDKPLSAAFHYRTARRPARRAPRPRGRRARRAGGGLPHALGPHGAGGAAAARHVEGHRGAAPARDARAASARSTPATTRPTSTASRRSTGCRYSVRVAVVSTEGPSDLGARADVVVGSTEELARLLEPPLSAQRRSSSRTRRDWRRATSSSVRAASSSTSRIRSLPARLTAATFAEVHEVGAVDAREALRRQRLLELAERDGGEVRAVVGVDAAVVAVGLREVHLLDVDQLGAAAARRRGSCAAAARPRRARSRRRSTTRASRSGSTGFSR